MHRSRVFTGLLLVSVLLVAALALMASQHPNPIPEEAEVQEVTVHSREFEFDPDRVRVRAGSLVRLTLDNTGGELMHDFTIDTVDSHGLLTWLVGPRVQVVAPSGVRAAIEFTPAEGAYLFYCSV